MEKCLRSLSINVPCCLYEAEPEVTSSEAAEDTDVDDIPTPSEQVEEPESDDTDAPEEDTTPAPVTIDYRFQMQRACCMSKCSKTQRPLLPLWHQPCHARCQWTGSVSYNIDDIDECTMAFSLPVT